MRRLLLWIATTALLAIYPENAKAQTVDVISARDFGAKGDGTANDTSALQSALDAACGMRGAAHLHVPAGRYNISSPLVTKCAMFLTGDGPIRSVIFQTVQKTLNHGIVANFPLTLQDISVSTTPLAINKGMVAVFRQDAIGPGSGPALGQNFSFFHFNSSGFNFGIDIAGTSDTDNLGAVVVRECDISVNTEPNAVANPVNVRNGESLTVEGSTLTGDRNNDHAIYTISVRKILIQNNVIQNHGNSAIKLLTGGFHATACPSLTNDYSSWILRNNIISNSKLALAAYTYCNVKLPSLVIADNLIYNIPNTHAGDAAAIYIQANCQSVMDTVSMSGNVFKDLGLSGVFLLSSVQGGAPCADLTAQGTINSFVSTRDKFVNFSISYPGMYYAISTSGRNLLRANISQLISDGQGHGRAALNLGAFAQPSAVDTVELDLANPDIIHY